MPFGEKHDRIEVAEEAGYLEECLGELRSDLGDFAIGVKSEVLLAEPQCVGYGFQGGWRLELKR